MAAAQDAQDGDLVDVIRGQYRPRVDVASIGTLARTTDSALIIETRTDDPASPEVGRVWLRTDL